MKKIHFGTNINRFTELNYTQQELINFVQTADKLGYYHLRMLDHVVGIHTERHGGIDDTPYTANSNIRECMTLIAYLSAITTSLRFETGILGLPQRQTVLVAKQAAEIDILSQGRLILGVGVGYNAIEFEAMGATFSDRGKRFEEQVHLLRELWTKEDVTFEGQWHTLRDVALAPRPIQRPIPLWFGLGRTDKPIPPDGILRRVGRLADGWLPLFAPGDEARVAIDKVRQAAVEAGRDADAIGMELNLHVENKSRDEIIDDIGALVELGACRLNVYFTDKTVEEHIDSLHRFKDMISHSEYA